MIGAWLALLAVTAVTYVSFAGALSSRWLDRILPDVDVEGAKLERSHHAP